MIDLSFPSLEFYLDDQLDSRSVDQG